MEFLKGSDVPSQGDTETHLIIHCSVDESIRSDLRSGVTCPVAITYVLRLSSMFYAKMWLIAPQARSLCVDLHRETSSTTPLFYPPGSTHTCHQLSDERSVV